MKQRGADDPRALGSNPTKAVAPPASLLIRNTPERARTRHGVIENDG